MPDHDYLPLTTLDTEPPRPQQAQPQGHDQERGNRAATEELGGMFDLVPTWGAPNVDGAPPESGPGGRRSDKALVADLIGLGEEGIPGMLGIGDTAILSCTRFMITYSNGGMGTWFEQFRSLWQQRHPGEPSPDFMKTLQRLMAARGTLMGQLHKEGLVDTKSNLGEAKWSRQMELVCGAAGVDSLNQLRLVFREAGKHTEFDEAAMGWAEKDANGTVYRGLKNADEQGVTTLAGKAVSCHMANGGAGNQNALLEKVAPLKAMLGSARDGESVLKAADAAFDACFARWPKAGTNGAFATDPGFAKGIFRAWVTGGNLNPKGVDLLGGLVKANGSARSLLAEQITVGAWATAMWSFPYLPKPGVIHNEMKTYLALTADDPNLEQSGDIREVNGHHLGVTEEGAARVREARDTLGTDPMWRGFFGSRVFLLQEILATRYGCDVSLDQSYGGGTETAVGDVQERLKMKRTGKADTQFLIAIQGGSPKQAPDLRGGANGSSTKGSGAKDNGAKGTDTESREGAEVWDHLERMLQDPFGLHDDLFNDAERTSSTSQEPFDWMTDPMGLRELFADAPTPTPTPTPTGAAPSGDPPLAWGATGPRVEALQRALGSHGHPVSVDGSFQSETYGALTAFQREHRLNPDGVYGKDSATAMGAPSQGGGPTKQPKSKAAEVSAKKVLERGPKQDAFPSLGEILGLDTWFDGQSTGPSTKTTQPGGWSGLGDLFDMDWVDAFAEEERTGPVLTGDPPLLEGSKGDQVRSLHELLNAHYEQSLPVTESFDATTKKAVLVAQAMAGLTPTGRVDRTTAANFTIGRRAPPKTEDLSKLRGWRDRGADPAQSRKKDVRLDVPFMNQNSSYNVDGTAWDGKSSKAFSPSGTACVDAAQAMALTTGAVSNDGLYLGGLVRIPAENVIQIFTAADEVANDRSFFNLEQGAQLHRGDADRMADVKERTLRGVAYIDAELEAGHAVVVGVTASTANRNRYKADDPKASPLDQAMDFQGTMDHGVVITGRAGGKYLFNDPGTQWGKGRLFVLDSDGVLKSDPDDVKKAGGQYYEVSTVIKNKNGKEEPLR